MNATPPGQSAAKALLGNRSFRILLTGSAISGIGDQFTLVAMPWLVLKLTGDPLALGTVLATIAVPQALLVLLGGAVVDRFDPRRVLLVARSANALLIALLSVLVATGSIALWMVYVIALALGVATAFVFPAGASILPRMLEPRLMPAANGVLMALRQLSFFVGPLLAGWLIAAFPGSPGAEGVALADARGIAFAFGVDAVTFVASIAALLVIRIPALAQSSSPRNVLHSMTEGVRAVWRDAVLRAYLLYVSLIAFFVGGPMQVGLPLLADARLHWGAASLGALMGAHGGGVLLGTLLTGSGVLSPRGRLGLKLLGIDIVTGVLLAALALVQSTAAGACLLLVLGVAGGFVQVAVFSWIQQRIPPERMGRTMGVVMFIFVGVAPLSAAGAGYALKHVSLATMFVVAGASMTAIAAMAARWSRIRTLHWQDEPARPATA